MRRPPRLLLWGLGLLLAVATAVGVFLSTLDADVYRRTLERGLSDALGRTVSIGELSIGLSLPVTLAVRDLRIANPAWASRPDFITAVGGDVRVGLIALWRGQFDVRALHLHGVDILLERNEDGAGNWTFGDPDRPVDLPDFDTVSLSAARIAWRHGDGTTTQLQSDRAEATIRAAAPFVLQGQVTYAETPMQLDVKADVPLQAALDGRPVQLAIVLKPEGSSLTLDARLTALDSIEDADVNLVLQGDRLDAWSAVVGQALPAWGPYRLAFQGRYARSSLQFENLRLSLDGLPMQPSRLDIGAGRGVLGADVDTRLTVEGKLGDAAFTLDASSAPFPALRRAGGELPLTLRATLAQFALGAEGKVARTDGIPHFDLALSVKGDAMAAARVFDGTSRRRPLPVDLSAHLTHDAGGYVARNIEGRILDATLSGDLAYPGGPRARLTGSLNLGRVDLGPPDAKGRREADVPDAPARASTVTGANSWLGDVDADVSLRIAAIAGLPVTARNVATRVQWREGVLGLQNLAATLMDTEVTGGGSVRWIDGRPQVVGSVRIALLDLAKFGAGAAAAKPGSALDAALQLAPLRALDADLQFEIDRITGVSGPIGKVAARAQLQQGKLDVDVASATLAEIPLQAHATVDASGNIWRVDASAEADRIDLEGLLRTLRQPVTAKGVVNDLQIKFGAQGTNVRALLAQAALDIRSAPFSLALGQDATPVAVQQASIEVEPGGPVLASMSGTAQGAPTVLKVEGGTLAQLLDSGRTWPLLLKATLPGAQASLQGTVNNLAASAGTPLASRVEIANLGQTAALFTSARLPAIPFNASGQISLGDGEVVIDRLVAQAGKSDASGRLRIRWQGRPQVSADLSARLIDTTQWEAATMSGISVLDRLIPAQALLAQDAQLHLNAERFIFADYDLDKLRFDGTLTQGVLRFTTAAAEGKLRGEVDFDVRRDMPGMALNFSLTDVETQTLYTAAGPSGATPRLSMRAQLAGSGTTLRDMLATGQGELLLTAGAGALPMRATHGLDKLAGNLLQVLLPGGKRGDDAQLECAAARFSIAKGIATSSDGIALRLKHVDILGGGAANLETGEILFGYRAVRRELFSLSLMSLTSGFAVVNGTIGNPTVGLDPGGLLIQGGAAWATAGLSLLAGDLWRKLESSTDPCVRIAAGAQSMTDPLDSLVRALPNAKLQKPVPARP